MPDRILIGDGGHYADMRYLNCRIVGAATRFIEAGSVPRDAERAGTTWKYVNQGGGRTGGTRTTVSCRSCAMAS